MAFPSTALSKGRLLRAGLMVFVVFGHVPLPFLRLAKEIDALAGKSQEDYIVQAGYTDFPFFHAKCEKFLGHSTMQEHLAKADIVVSHGGYGTLSEAVKMRKKVVSVPRLAGEHNHSQLELVQALEKEKYLLGVYEIADLKKKIAEARNFVPREFKKGNACDIINEFISKKFRQ